MLPIILLKNGIFLDFFAKSLFLRQESKLFYHEAPSAASGFALGRNQKLKIGSCGSGECFSPPPFFSPPYFLAKAAKSGLRRKTKAQKFLFGKCFITFYK